MDQLLADKGKRQLFEIFPPFGVGSLDETAELLS
jgi:hypothetical protein